MAEIINLDDLIPEDLELQYRGETFIIPGDLDTETVLKVYRTFRGILEVSQRENAQPEDITKEGEKLRELLLAIFQQRSPDLRVLPFGVASTPIVVQHLLQRLGVGLSLDGATGDEPDPTKAAPSRSRPKSAPASGKKPLQTRSSRSSGSRP